MTWLMILVGGVCTGVAVALGYRAALRAVDRLNSEYEADLRDRMERVGLDTSSLNAWMRGRVFWGIAIAVLLGFMEMGPIGLLSAAAAFMLLPTVMEGRILRARTEIRDQLVVATRNLAGQIRGKQILIRGLAKVAEQTPAPLGNLLTACTQQVARGVRLDAALTELKDRVRMDYMTLLVLSLVVGFEKKEGESLAELLDGIAHSLSENQRLDRKRDADTAAGRLLVNLLACFPIAFLGLFGLLDPDAVGAVFTTLLGQLVLCVVGAMTWFSVWLARRILGQVI